MEHAGPGYGPGPPHQISNHEFDGCQQPAGTTWEESQTSDQPQKYDDMYPHHHPHLQVLDNYLLDIFLLQCGQFVLSQSNPLEIGIKLHYLVR